MKVPFQKLALVDSRVADVVAEPVLQSSMELSFVVAAVGKLLLPFPFRDVISPLARVLVALIGVVIYSLAVGFVIFYVSLINAPVVEDVSAFSVGRSFLKSALVIGPVLKKELPLPMELIVQPLPMKIPFRLWNQVVSIREGPSTGVTALIPKRVGW